MKFVLIFVFLAYANFCLGNTTGSDQKVCATPCNPININVHGKEGVKGEKGEKGDSGPSCKCNLQDSNANKPSAHIEAARKGIVTYQANKVINDWSVNAPYSHLAGGMKYNDGKLTVPGKLTGRYYIYAQLYHRSRTGRVSVQVNDKVITMTHYESKNSAVELALYAGGVFYLKAVDVISLQTTAYSTTLDMSSVHSYFGAFFI